MPDYFGHSIENRSQPTLLSSEGITTLPEVVQNVSKPGAISSFSESLLYTVKFNVAVFNGLGILLSL